MQMDDNIKMEVKFRGRRFKLDLKSRDRIEYGNVVKQSWISQFQKKSNHDLFNEVCSTDLGLKQKGA
jgi:hypothetical protein